MGKRVGMCALLALVILGGLCLPDGLFALLDANCAREPREIFAAEGGYVYEGTLENRVRALDAWQNGSLNVAWAALSAPDAGAPGNVWGGLYAAGLLPEDARGPETTAQTFALSPRNVSARYVYTDIVCRENETRLHAILDAATGTPLRVEFTCAPGALAAFLADSGEGFQTVYKWDALLHAYANAVGGELADLGEYTGGEALKGYASPLRGGLLSISLKTAAAQGLLMYKLYARPGV